MREMTPQEQKTFRRLRNAFRRASLSMIKKKAHAEHVQLAIQRIAQHAIKLGWLTVPASTKIEA